MAAGANGLFVTGTDTGVGKTRVAGGADSCAAGTRPAGGGDETGGSRLRARRAERRCQCAAAGGQLWQPICAISIPIPLSRRLRRISLRRQAGVRIELPVIVAAYARLAAAADVVVVEGAGGWRVPLNEREEMADLAQALALTHRARGRAAARMFEPCLADRRVYRPSKLAVGGLGRQPDRPLGDGPARRTI